MPANQDCPVIKRIAVRGMLALCGTALALWIVPAGAQRAGNPGRVITQYDENTLPGGKAIFQRGVFRVENDGDRISMLCIPINGVWKYAGDLRNCGNPPPQELQREIRRLDPDIPYLTILNLGIDSAQWDAAQKLPAGDGRGGRALSRIRKAFSFTVGASDIRWRLESALLPQELKTQVPGGGLAVQFGGNFSEGRRPLLFEPRAGDIEVEVRMALPSLVLSGRAHAGLTIAVNLEMPAGGGGTAIMPLIVSLFHPDADRREAIRSDGRVSFASSYLGEGSRYIRAVEGSHRSSAWRGFERFAFRISRATARNFFDDATQSRNRKGGGASFDVSRLDQIRIAGVTVRNENRFLDQGDLTIEVVVDYLRLSRTGI